MTTARRALSLLVAALAVVMLAAACGGSGTEATTAEVEQSVTTARNRADFALERVTKASSLEELTERMEEASAAIEDAADELADVNVPDPYREETDHLVTALNQLSVDLSATASDLSRPEVLGELAAGARGINFESWDDANRALAALIGLGLDVKLLERH